MKKGNHTGKCPRCGYHSFHAAWCGDVPVTPPVRKGELAKPTQVQRDRTKYDRPSAKRHVDCRSVLLDPKDD